MRIKVPSKVILALAVQGTASAFFLPVKKRPGCAPLQNSYLESLKGERSSVKSAAPDAVFATSTSNTPLPHTPVDITAGVPTSASRDQNSTNGASKTSTNDPPPATTGGYQTTTPPKTTTSSYHATENRTPEVEVVQMNNSPANARAAKLTSDWSSTTLGLNGEEVKTPQKSSYERERQKYDQGAFLQNAQASQKSSYERERQKYDQGAFLQNTQTSSFTESRAKKDATPVKDDKPSKSPVIEVLPKDHPYKTDGNRKDYLSLQNDELAAANSQLHQENLRQKVELENFLRDSLANPLYPRIPLNRTPWEDDQLLESNQRLKEENEMQRQDLMAFQEEIKNLEDIIQSVEDKSYMKSQDLVAANNALRDETERQREELDAYKLQLTDMQNLVESIRDDALSLENEKKKLQNDKQLLESRLQGSETDSDRKSYDLQNSKNQIMNLQNVIQSLKDQNSALQSEKEAVITNKAALETKFDGAIDEFERQRHELDAYKKDRASMESLVQSIRDESTALKNEKTELQETVLKREQDIQKMSQQMATAQEEFNRKSAEKEAIVIESGEAYRQLQGRFQDTVDEMKSLREEQTRVQTRLQAAQNENERQRYEIENSNREKRALEDMLRSMEEETETLKNEKKTMESTLMNMQQTLQNLERELSTSAEEIERLRAEKDAALAQSTEYYDNYQELQLRFQEVLNDLEACKNDRANSQQRLEFNGIEQDFMSRINNRRQNQMRRSQIDEPRDSGWWN
eukprot:scaffold7017_cov134-Cylindrotheca_fusiformis.AAC.26